MEKKFSEGIARAVPDSSLIISVGLPGSWKSPVSQKIAELKGFELLRSDMIRLEVLRGLDIFDNKVASNPENRARVYEEMFRRAERLLKASSQGLILDATFFTQDLRVRAAQLAGMSRRAFVIIECVCTEERSIARILRRTKESYESNALTREAYLNNKAVFEPVDLDALKKRFKDVSMIHLVIDTEHDAPQDWRIKKIVRR